jgi:hypothetical protein
MRFGCRVRNRRQNFALLAFWLFLLSKDYIKSEMWRHVVLVVAVAILFAVIVMMFRKPKDCA